jgi:hypothetical protein
MKSICTVAVLLLAAVGVRGDDRPTPAPAERSGGWGPSWVCCKPAGELTRPEKLDKPLTRIATDDDRSVLGVSVLLWADAQVQEGHKYQLMYQLRVHTRKGELGPVLGTAAQPNGVSYVVASGTADNTWKGLEGMADINRKDLSGMTNLPTGKKVVLRIEPHLYDQTAGRFVTPGKTPAIIVLAEVDRDGRVSSVDSLKVGIIFNALSRADEVLDLLAALDEYDLEGNRIAEAIGDVLNNKEIPTPTAVRFIRAVPKQLVHGKNLILWRVLNDFADDFIPELKEAAKAKLEEVK